MDMAGSHSARGVEMQGVQQQPGGVKGVQQQPGGAGPPLLVQHTTINMVAEPPRDHIIWSLFSFVHANFCCLGLAALIFSIKARDRKMLGDLQGVQRYGAIARTINIVSTVLVCLIVVAFVIMYTFFFVKALEIAKKYNPYHYGH